MSRSTCDRRRREGTAVRAARCRERLTAGRMRRMLEPARSLRPLAGGDRPLHHARACCTRARSPIAEKTGGRGTSLAVEPLLGIARSYRLEFLNGAEEDAGRRRTRSATATCRAIPRRPAAESRWRARAAPGAAAIDRDQPVDHKQPRRDARRAGRLVHQRRAPSPRASRTYREAWKELSLAGATALLEAPRLIAYRPPPSSVKRSSLNHGEAEEHFVEVSSP